MKIRNVQIEKIEINLSIYCKTQDKPTEQEK